MKAPDPELIKDLTYCRRFNNLILPGNLWTFTLTLRCAAILGSYKQNQHHRVLNVSRSPTSNEPPANTSLASFYYN
jgi:hypothetical protein